MKKGPARKGGAAKANIQTSIANQDSSNPNQQKYVSARFSITIIVILIFVIQVKEYQDADKIMKMIDKAESGKPGA